MPYTLRHRHFRKPITCTAFTDKDLYLHILQLLNKQRQIFDTANENIMLCLLKQKVKTFLLTKYFSVISSFLCNLSVCFLYILAWVHQKCSTWCLSVKTECISWYLYLLLTSIFLLVSVQKPSQAICFHPFSHEDVFKAHIIRAWDVALHSLTKQFNQRKP